MERNKTPVAVTLPESLLLIAADDETGRISSKSGALDFGLAGGVLLELLLDDRLAIDDGKLELVAGPPTGDRALADAVARIEDSKPRDAKYWVYKLARAHVRDHVLEQLVQKNLVTQDEHRFLGVIPYDRYPAEDTSAERDIRATVRAAVLEGGDPQPRTAMLIGLLKATDLLGAVFSRDERKRHQQRIDEIANGETMGKTVSAAVKQMQNEVMAAAVAAVTAAAATAS